RLGVRNRREANQVSRQVLVVVAVNVVGVRARGSRVADGNARDDADGTAALLRFVGHGDDAVAYDVDVDRVVVGLHAAGHRGGGGGGIGIGMLAGKLGIDARFAHEIV